MEAPSESRFELETGRPQQRKGKVSIFSFIFHEHSFLGLFVPDNHVAPPITPCCCCCVFTDELTRRHRLFTFIVVFTLMMATTVWLHVGDTVDDLATPDVDESKEADPVGAEEMFLQIAIITPVTCFLKTHLPPTSAWFQSKGIGPWGAEGKATIRAEEVLLIIAIIYSAIEMALHVRERESNPPQLDFQAKALNSFRTRHTQCHTQRANLYFSGMFLREAGADADGRV